MRATDRRAQVAALGRRHDGLPFWRKCLILPPAALLARSLNAQAQEPAPMPAPTELRYVQSSQYSWDLFWNPGAPRTNGAAPAYEIQFLGGHEDGDDLATIIANGLPTDATSHLLWELDHDQAGLIVGEDSGLESQFSRVLSDGEFQLTAYANGIVGGWDRILSPIPGATMWRQASDTYAVQVDFAPATLATLGEGVSSAGDSALVGALSTDHVARVNWAAVRVRAVDTNGVYGPSAWSPMIAGYGVHLKPDYRYRTE